MTNTTKIPKEIDDQARSIAKHIVREMTLEVHKVTAHNAEPENYKLPQDPNSFEQILQKRFMKLKPEQKQRAMAKLLPLVKETDVQRKERFGDLHKVDLHSVIPVAQQTRALQLSSALKLTPATLQSISINVGTPNVGFPLQPMITRLELRIHRVKALDETGMDVNPFGDEPGSDEMYLGATTVDESGDTEKIPDFKIGDFDDDDVKTFSPLKLFASFDVSEGTEYPKSYVVILALAEKDQGGFPEYLNTLINKVKEKVVALIAATIGAAIGASGGPVGAVIGVAVGYAVGEAIELLKEVWGDDIFTPQTVSIQIDSPTYRFEGGKTESQEAVARFEGHDGTYEVKYSWMLVVTGGILHTTGGVLHTTTEIKK